MKYFITTLAALIFTGALAAETITHKDVLVIKVLDGDTIEAHQNNGLRAVINLAGIDAPELGQNGGRASHKWLHWLTHDLNGNSRQVTVKNGVVYLGDMNVNLVMVALGQAWCSQDSSDAECRKQQAKARKKGKGVHGITGSVPPWVWRKLKTGKKK